MDILSIFSRNFVMPLWACWERSDYLRHYRQMLKTQYDPPDVIISRQTSKMREIIYHAYNTCKFWRERFDSLNLKPEDIRELNDLRKIPILTKMDLRSRLDDMISASYSDLSKLTLFTTSGSTGSPVKVYADENCTQIKRGAILRSDEWTGWRRGEKIAAIWGNPKERKDFFGIIRNLLLDRYYVFLDTLKMDEQSMDEFTKQLLRYSPGMLFGHAHSLYLYAQFLRVKYPNVKIRPHGILSTCMVLHDFERRLISEVFGCRVTNRYGCEETSLIASDCERGEGLHVNSDTLYVELLDQSGEPVQIGEPGAVVVTDLCNRAMPMIRYNVGDTAIWSDRKCSCGRTLPLFERVEGRVADYVFTERGEYISGISLTENFACMVDDIIQLQIIQEDINRFTFNIVKTPNFNDSTISQIRKLVHERFGNNATFDCVFMDKIPMEKSGKYRFCISKIKKDFTQIQ
jgi:phenylacetate-CoA ligase